MLREKVYIIWKYNKRCTETFCFLPLSWGKVWEKIRGIFDQPINVGGGASRGAFAKQKQNINAQILISIIHYKKIFLKISKTKEIYLSSVNPMIGYNFL